MSDSTTRPNLVAFTPRPPASKAESFVRQLEGPAHREAISLIVESGVLAAPREMDSTWPLEEAVRRLAATDHEALQEAAHAEFAEDPNRLAGRLADLHADEVGDVMQAAYTLGIAVGRRVGRLPLTASGTEKQAVEALGSPAAHPSGVPTLRQRVERANGLVLLASQTLSCDDDAGEVAVDSVLAKAAFDGLVQAHMELFWIGHLSDQELDRPVPDDAQWRTAERSDGVR